MSHNENSKRFDLGERTFEFAKASRAFVKQLPRTISNVEDAKQFTRASSSIGANYIGERSHRQEGLRDENQDLPPRSEGKPLLASFDRHRWKTRRRSSATAERSLRIDENLRRNRPQIRAMNISKFKIPIPRPREHCPRFGLFVHLNFLRLFRILGFKFRILPTGE